MLLLLILTCFSWRSYIFMMFGEQRHLVRHFRTNICPSCRIFKSVCTFLICWCIVSVWPVVGQYAFVALVIILVENILVVLFLGYGWVVFFLGIVLIFWHFFFLFGKRYFIICRWYSSYIKSTIMVACLWCRIGCRFLLLLLWCCYLLVDLTAIFCWLSLFLRV